MKALLISIRPSWLEKILNGEKTIEVRRTRPKCELPIDVYIYCTKGNGNLWRSKSDRSFLLTRVGGAPYTFMPLHDAYDKLNGKVAARFKLRFVEKIYSYGTDKLDTELGSSLEELSFESCVPEKDLLSYVGNGAFYWVISDLEIFDQPKELSEFGLEKGPMSWRYVEEKE